MEIDFLDKFLIFFALKLFVCVVLQRDWLGEVKQWLDEVMKEGDWLTDEAVAVLNDSGEN
jgi:hypothetical protein